MPYIAFEACIVPAGDDHQLRRGAKATCGRCYHSDTVAVNNSKRGGQEDDEVIERMIAHKFEKHGWKIGKNPAHNRCPKCFSAIKNSAIHKAKETTMNKVVPMNSTAIVTQTVDMPRGERAPTRDERRIIIAKMQDVYLNETVGYRTDWTDHKVSEDMGVPRVWVTQIREDIFGPEDKNEETSAIYSEAREAIAVIEDNIKNMQNTLLQAEAVVTALKVLQARK
jgi:hypothetical protein